MDRDGMCLVRAWHDVVATTDAAAALVALHAALPAVKGRAGTRRPGPAHSASLRFYPEPRRMPEPMQASATMSPRIARGLSRLRVADHRR
jgi:hypothetical protein